MWIPEYLTKNKAETSGDQTLYIDLPEKEQISFLQLEIIKTNSATRSVLTSILDEIDKIEVIADGVKTLYNLEPELASYIHFLTMNGEYPHSWFNYHANGETGLEIIIPFGRYLFDPEYMLDTGLYDSVQLRIPYTLSTDYSVTTSLIHNIVMWRPLEKLAPIGFIRNRTVQKETSSGAAETISHKLPMTYPWRYLAVRAEDDDANIASDITSIKLNVDEGRLVPLDLNTNEIRDIDKIRFPRSGFYLIKGELTDQTSVMAHVDAPIPQSIVSAANVPLFLKQCYAAGETVSLRIYTSDGNVATEYYPIDIKVGGPNPHKCLTLFDGRDEPFPATTYTQAKVEYEMTAPQTTLHTFIQEIVLGKLS